MPGSAWSLAWTSHRPVGPTSFEQCRFGKWCGWHLSTFAPLTGSRFGVLSICSVMQLGPRARREPGAVLIDEKPLPDSTLDSCITEQYRVTVDGASLAAKVGNYAMC